MVGERRKARIVALRAHYEIDAVAHDPEKTVERHLKEAELSPENAEFARRLVRGVLEHRREIDDNIHAFAPAYPVSQLSIIDRNILRVAILEILLDNSVPVKVAINEAVELAKLFSGDSAARFVNGVLGSVSALTSR